MLEGQPTAALGAIERSTSGIFRLSGAAFVHHTLGHPRESQQALDELIAKYGHSGAYQIAPTRQSRWICIIDAPNVARFGGTALAMMIASPRMASPAPTSDCAMAAIIASVESNGCGTRRATTPQ